jgi:hypothetical protein
MGKGRLWYIGETCWSPRYDENKQWSNIQCIARNDPWFIAIQPFVVSSSLVASLALEKYENKVLRYASERQVFLIINATKHPVQSGTRLMELGFDFSDIIVVTGVMLLQLLPSGGNA